MTALEHFASLDRDALHEAARQACARIAPTWPLDRMIAVNPLWERREHAWSTVAAELWQRAGSPLTLSAADYRSAWQEGRIGAYHLQQALAEQAETWTTAQLLQALEMPPEANAGLPLLEDLADPGITLPGWRVLITQQIGQCCAAWFDHEQADWRPEAGTGLYQTWRSSMLADRGLSVLSDCRDLHGRIDELPLQPYAALEAAVQRLGLSAEDWASWFDCLLLRSLGWASWCAYKRWQANLQGQDDHTTLELLAIRAAWEWLVDDRQRDAQSRWRRWRSVWQNGLQQPPSAAWQALQVWQRADELAWQEQLQQKLCRAESAAPLQAPLAKLFFCIDVRSEPLRRALEQVCPELETGGFAGFFGLPIAYTPLGTAATRPQLPGLLAPQLQVSDSSGHAAQDDHLAQRRQARLARQGRWRIEAEQVRDSALQVSGLLQELELADQQIDLLVNNAGFGTAGAFLQQEWSREQQLVEVNILALTRLCHALGQRMVQQGGGQILNVASVAAFQPGPWMSNYFASKAYVLSLSEGLREELKGFGVKVSVLCPGPTRSAFFRNAQMKSAKLERSSLMMSCEEVALLAVRGLDKNRAIITPGWRNKLMAAWPRLAPRALVRYLVGKVNRSSSGRKAD